MPPRKGGLGYGTLYFAAKAAGYDGPPAQQSSAEAFSNYAKGTIGVPVKGERELHGPDKPFLMTEADIFALPDPEELVDGFIMCGENVCLFGQPKVGKTFIALDLALSIAANLLRGSSCPCRCSCIIASKNRGVCERRIMPEWRLNAETRLLAWRSAIASCLSSSVRPPCSIAAIAQNHNFASA